MPDQIGDEEDSADLELAYKALSQLFKFLRGSEQMMDLIDWVGVRSFKLASFIH